MTTEMRTIKFRGYNKKTRSWIHGFYFMNRGEHFIAPDGMQSPDRTWEDFLVVPESIGQFTGIKDKNGVEIYEGDFLRSDAYPYSIVEEGKLDNYYAEVYWQDNECGFYVVKVKNEKSTVVCESLLDYLGRGILL